MVVLRRVLVMMAFEVLASIGAVSQSPSIQHADSWITLGPEQVMLTTSQRAGFGFQFGPPDGTLGVLRWKGGESFFAAARSATNCADTPLTQGTYRLSGSLTKLSAPDPCKALIQPGDDPNGYTFDRDYAGGGPVMPIEHDFLGPYTSAENDAGFLDRDRHVNVLHVYHGEWQWKTCSAALCFYSSLGMALSKDGGATFQKLGEIIQPALSRPEVVASGRNLDVGGGTLILADRDGLPITGKDLTSPREIFVYVFYADRDPTASTVVPCDKNSCIAVARARLSEVIAAAESGDTETFPRLFHKYYQGRFSEPATSSDPDAGIPSGHYSPVVSDAGDFPTVVYDRHIRRYVMAYTTGNDAIVMRTGESLLSWSSPDAGGSVSQPGESTLYTTLIGEGIDPAVSDGNPQLIYVRAPKWPDWPDAVVVRREVHLDRQVQPGR